MGGEQSTPSSPSFATVSHHRSRSAGSKRSPAVRRAHSEIVTVHGGVDNEQDPEDDPDLVQLRQIPMFFPIFRTNLQIPGLRDPPDLLSKFDSRPLALLAQRIQDHLTHAAQTVATDQDALVKKIREADYAVATLTNYVSERQKRYARIVAELAKIKDLSTTLRKIDTALPEVVNGAVALNALLPDELKLEPLNLKQFCASGDPAGQSSRTTSMSDSGSPTKSQKASETGKNLLAGQPAATNPVDARRDSGHLRIKESETPWRKRESQSRSPDDAANSNAFQPANQTDLGRVVTRIEECKVVDANAQSPDSNSNQPKTHPAAKTDKAVARKT